MTNFQRWFCTVSIMGLIMGLIIGLLLGTGIARADVVSSPPKTCPAGAEPSTCHGGPHCMASACTKDADCETGRRCQQLALCARQINCAGQIAPGEDASKYNRDDIKGFCGNEDACAAGTTCKRLMVCAKPGADKPSSGGCSLGAAAPPAASVIVGLGILIWARRRRRS